MDKVWILTEAWSNGSLILGVFHKEEKAISEMEKEANGSSSFFNPDRITRVKRCGVSRIYGVGATLSVEPYDVEG